MKKPTYRGLFALRIMLLQIIEHHLVVFFSFKLVEYVFDIAILANKEANTMDAVVFFTHKLFQAPHPEILGNFVVFIAKQLEV